MLYMPVASYHWTKIEYFGKGVCIGYAKGWSTDGRMIGTKTPMWEGGGGGGVVDY